MGACQISEDRVAGLLWLVWTGRRFVIRMSVLMATLTLLLTLLTPNTYRSTTRLMPPDSRTMSGMLSMADLTSRAGSSELGWFGSNLPGTQSTGALLVAILRSRTSHERLVDQFDLTRRYARFGLRTQKEDVCRELEDKTEISEDRKSGIITISVSDRDRQQAAALANAYVDQLNRLIASLNTSAARREREFLEQRLAEVKKTLNEADHKLAQFSSKSATLDPKQQGAAMVEAAATLQGHLIAAQSELRAMQEIYSDNSVRVLSLRARISELKKQLAALSGTKVTGNPGAPGKDAPDLPMPSIRQIPVLSETYIDLARQAKIEEAMYQFLTQQYEVARVQEAKEIPTIRVLDPANVPLRKSGPHRLLMTLVGFTVGAMFGCLWLIGTRERQASSGLYQSLVADILRSIQQSRFCRASEAIAARWHKHHGKRVSIPEV
jgi:capsule polysaccharide export protein KpsE/RkpR